MEYKLKWSDCIKLKGGKICLKDILNENNQYPDKQVDPKTLHASMYAIPDKGVVFDFNLNLRTYILVHLTDAYYDVTLKKIVYNFNANSKKLEDYGYVVLDITENLDVENNK